MKKYILFAVLFLPMCASAAVHQSTDAAVYTSLQIIAPAQDGTIRDNNGTVNITIVLVPFLKSNNQIAIFLDGKQIGEPQATSQFILQNVDRGTHTLLAKVINNKGVILQQSNEVTFHLHRARITKTVLST